MNTYVTIKIILRIDSFDNFHLMYDYIVSPSVYIIHNHVKCVSVYGIIVKNEQIILLEGIYRMGLRIKCKTQTGLI